MTGAATLAAEFAAAAGDLSRLEALADRIRRALQVNQPKMPTDQRAAAYALGAATLASADQLRDEPLHLDEVIDWYHQAYRLASPDRRTGAALRWAAGLQVRGRPADLRRAADLVGRLLDRPNISPEDRLLGANLLVDLLLDLVELPGSAGGIPEAVPRLVAVAEQTAGDDGAALLVEAARVLRRHSQAAAATSDLPTPDSLLTRAVELAEPGGHAWLAATIDQASHLVRRAEATGQASFAADACRGYRAALDKAGSATLHIVGNLGLAEYTQAKLSQDRQLLDTAIRRLTGAVEQASEDQAWQTALNLSNALHERYEWTGKLADLNRAVTILDQLSPGDQERSEVSRNLGIFLSARFRRTTEVLDAIRATDLLRWAALSGDDDAAAKASEGNAWSDLFEVTGDREHLVAAIRVQRRALAVAGPRDPDRALYQASLGQSLAKRGILDRRLNDLLEARGLLVAAIRATGLDQAQRLKMKAALADLRAQLSHRDRPNAAAHTRRARRLYREIAAARPGLPEVSLAAGIGWGNWALERHCWREALEAYDGVRDVGESLKAGQGSWGDRELWLRSVQGVAQGAAYAAARLSRPQAAADRLEAGRLQLIAERTPPAHASGDRVRSVRTRIYLACTDVGTVAVANERILWLDEVSTGAVEAVLDPLRLAYSQRATDRRTWTDTLDQAVTWTSQHLIGPLVGFSGVGAEPTELVPTGQLSALPMSAAWLTALCTSEPAATAGVSVCAGRAIGPSWHRSSEVARLLAMADPRPTTRTPLPHGRDEVAAAVERIDANPPFLGRRATAANFWAGVAEATHVHVVCHGTADRERPLDSRLHLAGADVSVSDLLAPRLNRLELMILSACESGVAGDPSPDELIGIPAAVLAAGARGVIAADWAVDDLAAATLFIRFWSTWDRDIHPATQLVRAQRWLRDVTNDELTSVSPAHRRRARTVSPAARHLWGSARPYRRIVDHGAFTFRSP